MAYSVDLRERVVDAVNSNMHVDEAVKIFKVGRRTIYTWLELKQKTGSLEPKTGYQNGHSHRVKDLEAFEKFADENRGHSAGQMAEKWTTLTGVLTFHDAIRRALKKINFTHKKKSFTYSEADPKKRADYLEEISKIDPETIVYIDETGIDDNEVPQYAWAKRGQRAHAKKKAKRGTRYNIAAALNKNVLFAPFIYDCHTTQEIFEIYVELILIQKLRPGMVIVIDNASFHKSEKVERLLQSVNCRIIFLPPYSPDLNPIEHWWTAVKNKIRKAALNCKNFFDAAVQSLESYAALSA